MQELGSLIAAGSKSNGEALPIYMQRANLQPINGKPGQWQGLNPSPWVGFRML